MAVSHSYLGSLSSTTDGGTYSLGDYVAATDGLLAVFICGRAAAARTISSVSIGGVAATPVVETASNANPAGWYYRVVTAGTYAVSVTFSASMVRAASTGYLLDGYGSATASDTDAINGTSTSAAMTLDIPSGGLALYGGLQANTNAASWSAASEDTDFALESAIRVWSGNKASPGVADVETVSWTGSVPYSGVAAVWSPPAGGSGNARYYRQQMEMAV